jgi:PKD repeat protein
LVICRWYTQTLEGEIVTYTFDHSGVYNVTLTLQDSLGTDTDTLLLTIQDTTPPVAIIKYQNTTVSQSITVGIGQIVILDGSDSYDPENGTLTSYSWTSSGAMAKIGPVRNFSYPNPGTYEIALTVKDASLNNDTQTLFISVVEDPTQRPTLPPAKTPDATLPSSTPTPTTTTQSPPSPEYTPTPTAEPPLLNLQACRQRF